MMVTETPGRTPPASLTEPRKPPVNVWPDAVPTAKALNNTPTYAHRNRGFLMVDSPNTYEFAALGYICLQSCASVNPSRQALQERLHDSSAPLSGTQRCLIGHRARARR